MTAPRLTRLGFGTAGVGNHRRALTDDEATELLETAWEAGVRYFDTAPHYGLGLAELRLGRFLAGKQRDEYVVSTKVGRLLEPVEAYDGSLDDEGFVVPATTRRRWDVTCDGVRRSLEESLTRLGLDHVDVLYLHDPERTGDPAAVHDGLDALAGLRDEGAVAAVGVGSMDEAALLAAAGSGRADLLMAAGRYTLASPDIDGPVLDACAAAGVGVVAAAVFNGGLLAGGGSFDYADPSDEIVARVRRIRDVCDAFAVPLRTAALHFPLRNRLVRSVVVGGDTPAQIRDNAADLSAPVPDGLWAALAAEGLVPA